MGQNVNRLMGLIPSTVVVRTGTDWTYADDCKVSTDPVYQQLQSQKTQENISSHYEVMDLHD